MQTLKQFKRYTKNTDGNMTIIFAVASAALLLGVGAAYDTGMAHKKKSRLQDAADAAVLMAAKSGETTLPRLQAVAQETVNANNLSGATLNTTVSLTANGRVRVNVTGQYDTQLMSMFGKPSIDLAALSEAPLTSAEPVNIALVLDTTGSMSGAKLTSLKGAATNLVSTLESYNNSSLKVAVVPFSQYVNVGMANRTAPWIDVPADNSTTGTEVCGNRRDVISRTNPRRRSETRYNDGVPYTHTWTEYDVTYGPYYRSCYTPTSNVTWNGCVGSRANPWHERADFSGRRIPGLMNTWCGSEMLPLTNNMTTVKARINGLSASGNTYIPSGVVWGWRALDTDMPLTQASGPYAASTQKVMVLMTDGENTKSKSGISHNGNSTNNANMVTRNLCNNAKAEGVEIYTIAYEVNDITTKNMLRNCATNSGMYYDASNSAQLNSAFEQIASNLIKLRLTH